MTREQVKAVFDRVLSWPPERQKHAAELITLLEEQDNSSRQLTEEQVAEVRRRQADKSAATLSLDEFDQRLRRFGL